MNDNPNNVTIKFEGSIGTGTIKYEVNGNILELSDAILELSDTTCNLVENAVKRVLPIKTEEVINKKTDDDITKTAEVTKVTI